MATFQPIPARESTSNACARALRERILSGELAPGSRLPAERQLSQALGVNRLTLRSALGQLSAAGLLTVRHGSGYVVRDFLDEGGPDLLPSVLSLATGSKRRTVIADLLHLRRSLARAVLEKLAVDAGRESLAHIEAAVERFARVVDSGATAAEIATADRDMIRALITETKSPVLALAANPVFRVLEGVPGLREAIYAEPQGNLAALRLLVVALRERPKGFIDRILDALAELDRAVVERLAKRRNR